MLTGEAMDDSPSYIKEAAEMMKISNLTPAERRLYDIYEKNRQKQLSREEYVYDRGQDQERKKERIKAEAEKAELLQKTMAEHQQKAEAAKLDTARRLLVMGLSIEDAAIGADLDYDIVYKLK